MATATDGALCSVDGVGARTYVGVGVRGRPGSGKPAELSDNSGCFTGGELGSRSPGRPRALSTRQLPGSSGAPGVAGGCAGAMAMGDSPVAPPGTPRWVAIRSAPTRIDLN